MEYVICQSEAKGSIIVSEFTGVSATLNKAVKVNPWDLGVSLLLPLYYRGVTDECGSSGSRQSDRSVSYDAYD
jgi:hypothetical protein